PADSAFCPKCGQRVGAPAAGAPIRAAGLTPGRNQPPEPERELWHGSYSPKAMVGSWILAGLATIAGIVGCVFFPMAWIGVVQLQRVATLIGDTAGDERRRRAAYVEAV